MSALTPRLASSTLLTPSAAPARISSASRWRVVTFTSGSVPAAVSDTTRLVLCASARSSRVFGGSTAVIASPGPAA